MYVCGRTTRRPTCLPHYSSVLPINVPLVPLVPPSDTALMMIRSRHAIGRRLCSMAVARSPGHLPAAAARAVSCRHDLPCTHSSTASPRASALSVSCSTFDQSRQYNPSRVRSYSTSTSVSSSPFSGGIGDNQSSTPGTARKGNRRRKFIPRKAAVALTPKARTFFKSLLENVTSTQSNGESKQSGDAIIGIQLTYSQSTTGEPRMVFGFSFLRATALHPNDEAVSLEVLEDGETPKPPAEALEDGLPKLYVHHDAVLKVLGATLDVDEERLVPILYDKEGNVMDPNA